MSIHVAIRHTTRYQYDRPVSLSPHVVRLRPAAHSRTPILGYALKVEPAGHFISWQQDPFGNYLARLVFPERTRELVVDVEVIADLKRGALKPVYEQQGPIDVNRYPFPRRHWLPVNPAR